MKSSRSLIFDKLTILKLITLLHWVPGLFCQAFAHTPQLSNFHKLKQIHEGIKPSDTDPAIRRFNFPHYIALPQSSPNSQILMIFLSGTHGKPKKKVFFDLALRAGYRVISLAYNDEPSVAEVCHGKSSPTCAAEVRTKRIYGQNTTSLIDDTPAEAILPRLRSLLLYLNKTYPDENWKNYLRGNGLNWEQLAFVGHSQGAGMAAFIARQHRLNRVILFSSPWDNYTKQKRLSQWIQGPGLTPSARWFGGYHTKEKEAALIQKAYYALGIPKNQVVLFSREPVKMNGKNPYHSTLLSDSSLMHRPDGLPIYVQEWDFLLRSGNSPLH